MAKEKILGIDLGTTNSCFAIVEGGRPEVITNAEGGRTTPSVIHITSEGERIVGEPAKKQAIVKPQETVLSIKRHMGDDYTVTLHGKKYTPQELSSVILQKIKRDAEAYVGEEIKKAVITVPAYFTDAQRQATKDAGKIAGLEVERIINEPTAAALAYGLDKDEDLTILVFDFGGGTFDVSVLELSDGVFEVKSTAGDNKLGGDDVDQILIDYVADEFKKEHGIDLRTDPVSLQRLKLASEKAKIELSSRVDATLSEPFITATDTGPKHLDMKITRSKFDELIGGILDNLRKPTVQALSDAKLSASEIDKVILVGGSTRIPSVQKLVEDIIGKEPDRSVNPDEAVGLGAAVQGGVLAGEMKDLLLLDVTPLTLGIETLGGMSTSIIERNTTIPTKKSKVFSTADDNQTSVTIHVLQGERSMSKDNKTLGVFDLTGIMPAPRGVPQIEVSFDIDANGIVNVSAKDLGTGKSQEIKIVSTTNLKEEEIKKMQEEAEQYAEEDKKKKEEIETINNAESLTYTYEKTLKENADKVDKGKAEELQKEIDELKAELAKEEKDIAAIQTKTEALTNNMQTIATELYKNAQPEQGAPEGQEAQQEGTQQANADKENVVDVEVEENKEESKKE